MLKKLKIIASYLCVLFFAFGVPCLFGVAAVSGINNYFAAKSWKMTQATVAQSELIKEPKNWHAKIVYSYEVDGQRYWSDRISVDGRCGIFSFDDSEYLVEYHRVGSVSDVFYDPARPDQAVLYRQFAFSIWANIFYFIFFCTFIVIVTGFILTGPWRRKQRNFQRKLARYEARQVRRGYRKTPEPQNALSR